MAAVPNVRKKGEKLTPPQSEILKSSQFKWSFNKKRARRVKTTPKRYHLSAHQLQKYPAPFKYKKLNSLIHFLQNSPCQRPHPHYTKPCLLALPARNKDKSTEQNLYAHASRHFQAKKMQSVNHPLAHTNEESTCS